jgi:hypothetical protein
MRHGSTGAGCFNAADQRRKFIGREESWNGTKALLMKLVHRFRSQHKKAMAPNRIYARISLIGLP